MTKPYVLFFNARHVDDPGGEYPDIGRWIVGVLGDSYYCSDCIDAHVSDERGFDTLDEAVAALRALCEGPP